MSEITTYTCDICGKTSTNKDDLDLLWVCVGIKATTYSSFSSRFELNDSLNRKKQFCKYCRKSFGLVGSREEIKAIQETAPTLEDMIRRIVQEEIETN